ncbi:hypothetical protein D3C81_1519840 [compost metagenome]
MPVAPGLEELGDLGFAPAPKAGVVIGAQARCVPAIEQRTGQERFAVFIQGLLVEGQATRGMAAAAVPRALDDIGATIPQGVLAGLGRIGRGGGKQPVP